MGGVWRANGHDSNGVNTCSEKLTGMMPCRCVVVHQLPRREVFLVLRCDGVVVFETRRERENLTVETDRGQGARNKYQEAKKNTC